MSLPSTLPHPDPVVSPNGEVRVSWLYRWFTGYSRRYLRKHFDALRVLSAPLVVPDETPLVVYMNHASWWDPLTALVLMREVFPSRVFSAPMDVVALERYGIFRKLGCFYGVEQGTARGGRQFLRASRAILAHPPRALCLTPQGRFADVRQRPAGLATGLAHLLATSGREVAVLPLAVEYAFWNERTPNVFCHFAEPVRAQGGVEAWQHALESGLEQGQDDLAKAVIARDPSAFRNLLSGRAGPSGVYGWWQRCRAWISGEAHDLRHPPAR